MENNNKSISLKTIIEICDYHPSIIGKLICCSKTLKNILEPFLNQFSFYYTIIEYSIYSCNIICVDYLVKKSNYKLSISSQMILYILSIGKIDNLILLFKKDYIENVFDIENLIIHHHRVLVNIKEFFIYLLNQSDLQGCKLVRNYLPSFLQACRERNLFDTSLFISKWYLDYTINSTEKTTISFYFKIFINESIKCMKLGSNLLIQYIITHKYLNYYSDYIYLIEYFIEKDYYDLLKILFNNSCLEFSKIPIIQNISLSLKNRNKILFLLFSDIRIHSSLNKFLIAKQLIENNDIYNLNILCFYVGLYGLDRNQWIYLHSFAIHYNKNEIRLLLIEAENFVNKDFLLLS